MLGKKGILIGGVIGLMAAGILGYTVMAGTSTVTAQSGQTAVISQQQPHKSLVVYFAYSENIGDTSNMTPDAVTSASLHGKTTNKEGNMQVMVQEIQKRTGADVYSIVAQKPYAPNFDDMTGQARADIQAGRMMDLKNPLPDLSQYDVIYLGTPVWWYTLPAPVSTFLQEADLSGKIVVPFGIHRGSGFSSNLETIQALQPGARLTQGFTVDAQTDNQKVRQEFAGFLNQLLGKQ